MKLIIFGASGGTGRQLVKQALDQGHLVTAFVRDPAKAGARHANLTIVQGDALDPAAVARAVPGHDAVLSSLGAPAVKTGTIRSEGTRNIVHAMEQAGVRRLISQASLGYGDSRTVLDRTPFYFKYLIVPLVLRRGFADHMRQEEQIKRSRLDWTIVRPGNLTDGDHTGVYRHGFPATDKAITVTISRADVADFMLRQLMDDSYLHQTPGVSY
jgi:putative NADH-flavin reductase